MDLHDLNNQMEIIVIDNGSYETRMGFAGEEKPRSVVPTLFGYHRWHLVDPIQEVPDYFAGREAEKIKGIINIKYPVKNRIIDLTQRYPVIGRERFYYIEKIWEPFFNDLGDNNDL